MLGLPGKGDHQTSDDWGTAVNNLASRIHHHRTKQRLSLDQLASMAGISKTYLWELENDTAGDKTPSVAVVLKIGEALCLSVGELLGIPAKDQAADQRTIEMIRHALGLLAPDAVPTNELRRVQALMAAWQTRLYRKQRGECEQ